MVYSRKYSRNFIPLKQDSPKYNLDFRPSLGRCVIEIKEGKGKINIYAQGIKPNVDYNLELIGFNKGDIKNISLGIFNVDEYGKGEFSNTFDPDNMLDNNKIEDFNVISVMAKNDKDVSSALVGYMDTPVNWKDQYKANFIINMPKKNCPQNPINNDNKSDFEKGLIEREEGLIEKEEGLIEKEKGIIEKEKNNTKIPLDEYENILQEKLEGLLKKEQGLAEKEQGLIEKERNLRQGYLPDEDKDLREKELELIKREMELIKIEQELINREKLLIRPNPSSEREKGLIEKEKGVLEREQGLLEREKGLIEKEKGLLEIEKGIRQKNRYTEASKTEENTNHTSFKNMLDNLKKNMLDIENMEISSNTNKDIEHIKTKNAVMAPFSNNDDNTTWHRISPYDLINISKDSWEYSRNPFVIMSYKKYKHLMLGIDNKNESYKLAVPCVYKKDFNLTRFKEFLPIDSNVSTKSLNNGEYGYRIENL